MADQKTDPMKNEERSDAAAAQAYAARSSAPTSGTDASKPGSGDTVSVGCKLPHGLIIQLEELRDTRLPNGAIEQRYVTVGPPLALNGANSSRVIGGYGITEGVNEKQMRNWLAMHPGFGPVVAGLIFIQPTVQAAQGQAKEQAKVQSGLEPIDPRQPGARLAPEDDQPLPPAA